MDAIRDQLLKFFKLDQTVVRARGGSLWLEDGNKVFDFLSQYGANPLGANDRPLLQGIREFLDEEQPMLCQPLQATGVQRLKKRLLDLSAMHKGDVLLCQSGAEAVELAIKIARTTTGKPATIALEHGFHGKTTGSVQLTANAEYRKFFGVENTFVRRLSTDPDGDLEADFRALSADNKVNAVILEFVQGEGGMRELDKRWVQRLVELARASGILVIADEVQTGLGRTGKWLACEHYDVTPDVVLLAKALGGGMVPIGACLTKENLCPPEFTLYHSSTFANNNFTCSIANGLLDRLEEGVIAEAERNGEYLGLQLAELVERYPDVFSKASGLGLMRGIHLHPQRDSHSYVSNLFWHSGLTAYAAAGWLLRTQKIMTMPCFRHPSCLRLQPPLNSTRTHIDRGIEGLKKLAGLLRTDLGATSLLDTEFDDWADDLVCFGRFSAESADDQSVKTRKLITSPPSISIAKHNSKSVQRFQFAIHPLHDDTSLASLPYASDKLPSVEKDRLGRRVKDLIAITRGSSAECFNIEPFRLGDRVIEGRLFALNMTAADIMSASSRERKQALQALSSSAHRYNPDVFGLGAFTSIIAQGGFLLRELPHTVTTGSSLTAFAAVHAALLSPKIPIPQHFGVIGANGGVGSLCWQMLICSAATSHKVGALSLLYNPQNPNALRELANTFKRAAQDWLQRDGRRPEDELLLEVARVFKLRLNTMADKTPQAIVSSFVRAVAKLLGEGFLTVCASDETKQLRRLDRVLVATNRVDGVKELHEIRSGAALYDIGYPLSFDPEAMATEGKNSFSAGLVNCPGPWEFGRSNIAGVPAGMSLGCFAETMTLAATDPLAAPRSASIKLSEAQRVGELALSVGFEPGVVVAGCPKAAVKPERLIAL